MAAARGIQTGISNEKTWKHLPFSTCILGGGMQHIIKKKRGTDDDIDQFKPRNVIDV